MTMTFPAVVDYSYARPDPNWIRDSGYGGVLRYLGDDSRCLTVGERDALLGAGLGIGLIWETSAQRPLAGYQAGVDDAHAANREADQLGAPGTRIYYAVDFAPTPDQLYGPIADYFRGACSVAARPVRSYGCASVMQALVADLGLMPDAWQCAAWSYPGTAPGTPINDGGWDLVLSPHASMLQNIGYVLDDSSDHNSLINTSIAWMWGKDGEDEDDVTQADMDEIVNRTVSLIGAMLDDRLTNHMMLEDEHGQFEVVVTEGGRRRRPLAPGEAGLLRSLNEMAQSSPVDITKLPEDQKQVFYDYEETGR